MDNLNCDTVGAKDFSKELRTCAIYWVHVLWYAFSKMYVYKKLIKNKTNKICAMLEQNNS